MVASNPARTAVFISYSRKDKKWLRQLQVHLKPLEREGLIDRWDDTRMAPGQNWQQEIRGALDAARVAVLLVSADFLASDFISAVELPSLLRAAEQEGLVVLPVIVSPCRFIHMEGLSRFQSVNDPSRTLADLRKADRARVWVKLTEEIERVLVEPVPTLRVDAPPEERGPSPGVLIKEEQGTVETPDTRSVQPPSSPE